MRAHSIAKGEDSEIQKSTHSRARPALRGRIRSICRIPGQEGKQICYRLLQKGDEANEYSITDESGKVYGLRSSAVKLGDHLGHKVTVTGRLVGEKNEGEEREGKAASKEAGDIQVTKLTMVSTSCQ